MTAVDDLAAWLTRIWDEQEEIALNAAGWDRSGRNRANGQWIRSGISSLEDDERRSVIYSDSGQVSEAVADHVARHDPASVLARIAADRQILADWQQVNGEHQSWCEEYDDFGAIEDYGRADQVRGALGSLERTVRLLALPYADRPGYQEAWRVAE